MQKNELGIILKCHLQNGFINHIYLIYMYKEEFAFNNLQCLLYYKMQPNPNPPKSTQHVIYHVHHGMPTAWFPLNISHYPSLWSSLLASSQVFAGRLTLVCQCVGVQRRMSFICSSLLHQPYPTCYACLTWMMYEMGGN